MPQRLIARLRDDFGQPTVKHYCGLPPELTEGKDRRELLGPAAVVVIAEKPSGVFLVRFTADGRFAGDTWHPTVQEAKEQAIFEFADRLSEWQFVPNDVEDVVAFGLKSPTE
jgi:hypothetical protein